MIEQANSKKEEPDSTDDNNEEWTEDEIKSAMEEMVEEESKEKSDIDTICERIDNAISEKNKENISPLYSKYKELEEKYPDSIIAYRVGDFYEIFGDNAKIVANEVDLTLTGRDFGLSERIPIGSCGSDPSDRLIFLFNYRCGNIGYTFGLEKSIYPSCISVKATVETLAGNTYQKREKRREIRDFDFDCLKEYLERIDTRETSEDKCKYFIADRTTGKEYGFDRIEKCLLDFFNYYSDIKLETDPADIADHHDSRYVKIDDRSVESCEFKGNRFIRYVSVPEGVPHIGDEAFAGSSLREISFPDAFFAYSGTRKQFPTVGKNIFIGCEDLSFVVCDDDFFSGISKENVAAATERCVGAESGALLLRNLIECTKTLPNVCFIRFDDRKRNPL